jgi:hypothetical protein
VAKLTLLEIVQDILSDMVSDEINSIDDTVEAQSVAQIVKTCYLEMIAHRNWPHTKKLVQFEGLATTERPNYMRLPEALKELVSFEYDCRKTTDADAQYKELKYKHPDEFLRMSSLRKSGDANVKTVVDSSGVSLFIYNDRAPEYYTSFDDVNVVCDAYDSSVDDTLKTSKSSAIAYMIPSWERSDTAVPDLPAEAFPSLLSEAKSTAFYVIKQMTNEKEEMKATRQSRWLSRKAWRTHGGVRYEDYGRKSRR